jgi:hypothetical protein
MKKKRSVIRSILPSHKVCNLSIKIHHIDPTILRDNTRVSLTLAACNLFACVFKGKGFSVIIILMK